MLGLDFDKYLRELRAGREEILRAFVAKYGYGPDEIMQISSNHPNYWYVTKTEWNKEGRFPQIPEPPRMRRIW